MYFFATQSELPADVGFSLFGPAHLAWIVFTLLGTALGLVLLRRKPRAQAVTARAGAILAVLLVALLELWSWWSGDFSAWSLPLHLCDMTPFLLLDVYKRQVDGTASQSKFKHPEPVCSGCFYVNLFAAQKSGLQSGTAVL